MAPVVTPDDVSARVGNLLELFGKLLISLGAIWALVEKIIKPYSVWRREKLALMVKEILKEELEKLDKLIEQESSCAGRMERVLKRQEEIFDANDLFLEIASDNRDRHDETNELLNQVFNIDRRGDHGRREEINMMLDRLRTWRHARRRSTDDIPVGIVILSDNHDKP